MTQESTKKELAAFLSMLRDATLAFEHFNDALGKASGKIIAADSDAVSQAIKSTKRHIKHFREAHDSLEAVYHNFERFSEDDIRITLDIGKSTLPPQIEDRFLSVKKFIHNFKEMTAGSGMQDTDTVRSITNSLRSCEIKMDTVLKNFEQEQGPMLH